MLLAGLRAEVADVYRTLVSERLVAGTSGNVTARDGDLIAVTPSGLDYADLTPELVGVHHLDGRPAQARLDPTSELPLHLAVYAATDARAIVHTHSLAAIAVSVTADELPAVHYMIALFGGPVRVAPYATYGTDELAASVVAALRDRTGCLIANHGAVATGQDLRTALSGARYLEWLSELYLRAIAAGTPRLLPDEEIARVARKLASYGQRVLPRGGQHWPSYAPVWYVVHGSQSVPSSEIWMAARALPSGSNVASGPHTPLICQ
jgi:L-fuculose-phosphate aldolase